MLTDIVALSNCTLLESSDNLTNLPDVVTVETGLASILFRSFSKANSLPGAPEYNVPTLSVRNILLIFEGLRI